MPKKLVNWSFRDVESFLKDRGFRLNYTNSSHYFFIAHKKGILRNVCVPFHGKQSIKPRTLKGIILQSGIDAGEWLK